MITGTILQIVYYFIYGLISLFPTGATFPTEWASALHLIFGAVALFSLVVPLSTLVKILALAMTFHLFVWIWNTTMWIISIVRGVNVFK